MRSTRRQFIGGTAGLAAGLATMSTLAHEGAHGDATPAASPGASPVAGGWSFTDDHGVTVTADAAPTRIVADVNAAAPLWDFGVRPVAVFGWNASESGNFGAAGGNIDPSAVAVVGDATEPFKTEAVLAEDPDLLVTLTWAPSDPADYWSFTEAALVDQARQIAPLIAMSAAGFADANTDRFAELATSLGADLSTPELTAAKADYTDRLTAFPDQAASKADLKVLFMYIAAEGSVYFATPKGWADLSLYQKLGVNIVLPETDDPWWQEVSQEEAGMYPADVIFHSTRPGTLSVDEMKAHPTLGQHPAIKAGQIGEWNQDFIMSWQGMSAALDSISGPILAANKVI